MKRTSKTIRDPKEIEYLVSLTDKETTKLSFIMEQFGNFKGKHKHEPYDLVTIPPGSYGPEGKKNKNAFTTTIGLWIFNKTFIEPGMFDIFHYINKPVNSKTFDYINSNMSYAVLEDKISLEVMKDFILKCQKFQPYADVLCWSFTDDMLLSTPKINKKKAELMKKYKDRLDAKDPKIAKQIEEELLDYSKEILKDDPSLDMFDSGAKGKFGNNFKNLFVMRGAIKDPDPAKGYDIVMSNYMDGISKEDYVTMSRSLAAGPYSRARKTQYGGYLEKLFLRALQHVVLLPAGTDCGTKRTIDMVLEPSLVKMCMYNYVVDNGKLVELTSDTIDKYVGKRVKMRFASLCESKNGICNKCIGNFFYRVGITNIGAAAPQVASRLKVISMKAFHDAQIKLHEIDVASAFVD